MNKISLTAFHDYDIRGIYPDEINEEFYYHLGKAIALYVKKSPIAVGYDARLSSPSLSQSLIKGVTDYGYDVVELGQISTEMHNFASGKYDFAANITVTASHNPPEYNGAKITTAGAIPLHGTYGLPEIKSFMNKDLPKAQKKGSVTKKNIFGDWISHALSFIQKDSLKNLKVVVDGGNGMGGPSWVKMKELLPVEIIGMYLDPDGTFPNHEPNPLKDENTKEIEATVVKERADLGIALDGDADRIFFIDEEGVKLSGTVTAAILAAHFLEHEKGYILYNAICGRIVPETIKALGGTAYRTRVGHSFIKEAMRKLNAIMAGEHSGHFYFRDCCNAESTLVAGLLMLQILSEKKVSLSSLRKKYDVYAQSGEINFKVDNRELTVEKLKEVYGNKAQSVDDLDGYSFWFPTFWFNVRLSKTEPLLRLNMEADTKEILDENLKEIIKLLETLKDS